MWHWRGKGEVAEGRKNQGGRRGMNIMRGGRKGGRSIAYRRNLEAEAAEGPSADSAMSARRSG